MGVAGGDCGLPDWLATKSFSREVAATVWRSPEKSRRRGEVFPARKEISAGENGREGGDEQRRESSFLTLATGGGSYSHPASGVIVRGYKKTIRVNGWGEWEDRRDLKSFRSLD